MRRTCLIAALLFASPVNAQAPASDYDRAAAARLAHDPETALRLLEPIVTAQPENSDARLQLGLAQLALGRLADAEASFRRVLEIAPQYRDARIGLARVAQRRGDNAAALVLIEPLPSGEAEVDALRRALAEPSTAADRRLRIDVDLRYSHLDGQKDWRDVSLQMRRAVSPRTTFAAGVEASHRFGKRDVYGEVRMDRRLSTAANVYVTAGGTPNADFRPEWQVGAGGSLRVAPSLNPTVVTLDLRHARYETGDIRTASPGVQQYLAGGKVWLTGTWINTFAENGGHSSGWLARGDAMASDRLRLFAGASDAPDTSEGIVVDTFSLFGGLVYDLNDRHSLRLSAAREKRQAGPKRLEMSVGLGVRL